MSWGFWTVVGIVVLGAVWLISIYNGLVAARNRFKNAFAQIDVQLKRRYDLIPNLVETAKGYIKHERETLEAVIVARAGAQNANQRAAADPGDAAAMKQMIAAEAGLSGALGRLFALSESYPDLKANQNMMQLTEELTSTENRISFARQAFNDAVKKLGAAETALGGALTRFFAVAESYPDLKANQNLMQVSEELSSTENKIAFARQAFNDTVMTYNNAVQQFPGNLVANAFGFKEATLLEATESPEERKPVKVSFS